jgi:hypothetical protein
MKKLWSIKSALFFIMALALMVGDACHKDESTNTDDVYRQTLKLIPDNVSGLSGSEIMNSFIENSEAENPGGEFSFDAMKFWFDKNGQECDMVFACIERYSDSGEATDAFLNHSDIDISVAPSFQIGEKSAIVVNENDDGYTNLRWLLFIDKQFYVVVGSFTTDSLKDAPGDPVLQGLAQEIESGIDANFKLLTAQKPSDEKHNQSSREFPYQLLPDDMKDMASGSTVYAENKLPPINFYHSDEDNTGVAGKAEFVVYTTVKDGNGAPCGGGEMQCHRVEAAVYLSSFTLDKGQDDHDGLGGGGDVVVAGEIDFQYSCNAVLNVTRKFLTGEIGLITDGETLSKTQGRPIGQWPVEITKVVEWQCPLEPSDIIITRIDLVFQENDVGGVLFWLSQACKWISGEDDGSLLILLAGIVDQVLLQKIITILIKEAAKSNWKVDLDNPLGTIGNISEGDGQIGYIRELGTNYKIKWP